MLNEDMENQEAASSTQEQEPTSTEQSQPQEKVEAQSRNDFDNNIKELREDKKRVEAERDALRKQLDETIDEDDFVNAKQLKEVQKTVTQIEAQNRYLESKSRVASENSDYYEVMKDDLIAKFSKDEPELATMIYNAGKSGDYYTAFKSTYKYLKKLGYVDKPEISQDGLETKSKLIKNSTVPGVTGAQTAAQISPIKKVNRYGARVWSAEEAKAIQEQARRLISEID